MAKKGKVTQLSSSQAINDALSAVVASGDLSSKKSGLVWTLVRESPRCPGVLRKAIEDAARKW